MGTLFLNQMKKQARSFLQEKYKTARLALTDVAPIEFVCRLTEEATNNDPWGPDAKTMTKIAVASFGVDAYCRIVEIIHKRLDTVDWKQWRQSYKTLVLLEFLMTHGPEELANEFHNDIDIIEELGTFQFIDEKGFNWGMNMQKRADNILGLLRGGETALKEARVKALKISKEIQGFGSSTPSSAVASSSPTASTSTPSSAVSDCSFTTAGSTFEDICRLENITLADELDQYDAAADDHDHHLSLGADQCITYNNNNNKSNNNNNDNQVRLRWTKSVESGMMTHCWDGHDPVHEKGSLLDDDQAKDRKPSSDNQGLVGGFCAKIMTTTTTTTTTTTSPKKDYGDSNNNNNNIYNDDNNGSTTGFRSFSDVGKFLKKRYDRQFSIGY
ncbi:Epn2 [Linum grandiflorum]